MFFENIGGQFVLLLDEGAKTGLFTADQLGGYLSTFVLTIINLLIAYLVIRFLIFDKIIKIVHDREAHIKNEVDEAEKANAKAKETEENCKNIIDDAKAEAAKIIADAKESADNSSKMIILQANEEASNILARTDDEVKRMKINALEDMKDEISDLAVEVSEKVIGDVVAEQTLRELSSKHLTEILNTEVNKGE